MENEMNSGPDYSELVVSAFKKALKEAQSSYTITPEWENLRIDDTGEGSVFPPEVISRAMKLIANELKLTGGNYKFIPPSADKFEFPLSEEPSDED